MVNGRTHTHTRARMHACMHTQTHLQTHTHTHTHWHQLPVCEKNGIKKWIETIQVKIQKKEGWNEQGF